MKNSIYFIIGDRGNFNGVYKYIYNHNGVISQKKDKGYSNLRRGLCLKYPITCVYKNKLLIRDQQSQRRNFLIDLKLDEFMEC